MLGSLYSHRVILNLNPAKACGPDELPAKFLFQFLFQQSYDSGMVPDQWRHALVTAIYKKGPKTDPGNYRPISLTCLCCKIMEHIILSHISKHLASSNILLNNQHGFREHLSTTTQLISATDDWVSSLDH